MKLTSALRRLHPIRRGARRWDLLTVLAFVCARALMAHELRLGERVPTFGQRREVFGTNFALQSPQLDQVTPRLAMFCWSRLQ